MPYLLRRFMQSLLLLFVLISFVFVVGRIIGDPALIMLGTSASETALDQLRENLGLNQPIWQQYLVFLGDLVQGDFGVSFRYGFSMMPSDALRAEGTPVLPIVLSRLPATFLLAGTALVLAFSLAVVLGCLAAMYPRSWIDNLVNVISLASVSVVQFWLGLILIIVFSVQLGLLPTGGYGSWQHLILPALTLAARPLGRISQVVRSAMLDELSKPYIAAARAKGVPEWRVVFVHALKNASIPIVTITGDELSQLLTGAMLVETVFAWPGIGLLLIDSLGRRDLPMVQAGICVVAALVILVNLAVDFAYTVLNPRIEMDNRGGRA
ncbi:MAG: ABC transporter permease [Marinovum algicola]|jgi:peptide/nickel transport system permease protein|uniref:Peptide/nickel transport system permease protein n=1 Tax=Marinovum algicola TaxID=42444 RepID=A0A975WCV3_9RHOB|nr:ABC transporter permease [Marinovum algicola]AKP00011.1 ABC-type Dipeptide transport system permease protein DppB [Marinovum algicola DG 898]SEJ95781.1 peptide/nickel transport system permease protein [Marinovum algicola]SLN68740.1 Glutathione transport system permease protein GsiC [Marinovum algicola]